MLFLNNNPKNIFSNKMPRLLAADLLVVRLPLLPLHLRILNIESLLHLLLFLNLPRDLHRQVTLDLSLLLVLLALVLTVEMLEVVDALLKLQLQLNKVNNNHKDSIILQMHLEMILENILV